MSVPYTRVRADRRAALALGTAALTAVFASTSACRPKDSMPPLDLEVTASPGESDFAGYFPPWSRVEAQALGNGTWVHELHEAGTPRFHLRVILPTLGAATLNAAAVAIASEDLQRELSARLRRWGADLSVVAAPGRIELVIRGASDYRRQISSQTAKVLAGTGDGRIGGRRMARAMKQLGRWVATYEDPALTYHASVGVARALGLPEDSQWAGLESLAALDEQALDDASQTLTDPARAWVVIHADLDNENHAAVLAQFARAWPARDRQAAPPQGALARLHRSSPAPVAAGATPESSAKAPDDNNPPPLLRFVEAPAEAETAAAAGDENAAPAPVLLLIRALDTVTPIDRCRLRLAQRLLQESFDARVSLSGPRAVLSIRIRLPRKAPRATLEAIVTTYESELVTQPSEGRLGQAARSFLGARMVEVSLHDEDWTELWSDALDLADDDKDIASVLHARARCMLSTTPEQLRGWQRERLSWATSPEAWQWLVIGATRAQRRELEDFWPRKVELEDDAK